MPGLVARKVRAEPFGVPSLADVIRLSAQGLGELLHQSNHVILLRDRPAATGGNRQVVEDLQVLLDLGGDAGPLYLDHDGSAVRQARGVDLPDGGSRQRDLREITEDIVERTAGLRFD